MGVRFPHVVQTSLTTQIMKKFIKAIVIDSKKATVEEIYLENTLDAKYKTIGNGCSLIETAAYLPHNNDGDEHVFMDVMYCDEEMLISHPTMDDKLKVGIFKMVIDRFWGKDSRYVENMTRVITIVGNAIIVGTDKEGNTIDHRQDLDEFKSRILGFASL